MNRKLASLIAAPVIAASLFGLSGCTDDSAYKERVSQQKSTDKAVSRPTDTLEQKNLRKRIAIEEKADQIGYVYLFNRQGDALGYYTIKGKVSSSGSQLAPEQDIIDDPHGDACAGSVVVDSAQDDGTYGQGDDGIFFFTADGVFVHTNVDYLYSTQPLAVKAPELEAKKS